MKQEWKVELQDRQGGERQWLTFGSMDLANSFVKGTSWEIINWNCRDVA